MPYQSPPPVWMPAAEAIRHIQKVDEVTANQAIEQLRQAIEDGAVGPRWVSMIQPRMGASPLQAPSENVAATAAWRNAQIAVVGSVAFGDEAARQFDVIRSQVLQHWPIVASSAEEPPPRVHEPVSATDPPTRIVPKEGGRPSDKDLIIREAERRIATEERLPDSLAAFARDLHAWLDTRPNAHRAQKTGKVMTAATIAGHVRRLWDKRRQT